MLSLVSSQEPCTLALKKVGPPQPKRRLDNGANQPKVNTKVCPVKCPQKGIVQTVTFQDAELDHPLGVYPYNLMWDNLWPAELGYGNSSCGCGPLPGCGYLTAYKAGYKQAGYNGYGKGFTLMPFKTTCLIRPLSITINAA